MRQIKFRGRAETSVEGQCKEGEWVFGNLIVNNGNSYIVGEVVDVDDEYIALEYWIPVVGVGEFTGLLDKNGKEIYEGDIVGIKILESETIKPQEFTAIVGWDKYKAAFELRDLGGHDWSFVLIQKYEVIGNIYENPELLTKEAV